MEFPAVLGGSADVGDGNTSLSLEGSFLSLFQMPVPQGNEAGGRPIMAEEAECVPHGPPPVSPDGVPGCEEVDDIVLLAKEPFLWGLGTWGDVSVNQDARRTGWCGRRAVWVGSGTRWSLSSSELANASESGVEVRPLSLSRRTWLEWGRPESPPCPGRDGVLGLTTVELMIQLCQLCRLCRLDTHSTA